MTDIMETDVEGDPTSCRAAITVLADAVTGLTSARGRVDAAIKKAADWHGLAGVSFEQTAGVARADLDRVSDTLEGLDRALGDFASELEVVLEAMSKARGVAYAGGLWLDGTRVHAPTGPAAASELLPGDADVTERRITAWNSAVEMVAAARIKEQEAHQHLADAVTALESDHLVKELLRKLGLLPDGQADGLDYLNWGVGLSTTAFGAKVSYMTSIRFGSFVEPGAHRAGGSLSFLDRVMYAADGDNVRAHAGAGELHGRWGTAGKVVGVGGSALSGVLGGWDQWQEDADRPDLSTSERAGRTAAVGGSTAAGAWAGGEAGAWAGGAIGTAICPGVGTVIGGVAGGIIGGAAGAWAGSELGEATKDLVGEGTEMVTDFIGDAAGGIGDVASGVGDKLSFWD